MTGTIDRFIKDKKFGFIKPDTRINGAFQDHFFHIEDCYFAEDEISPCRTKVSFDSKQTTKGMRANNVVII